MQRISLFYDWWATEQFYTYRYIENGEFYRERIPILEAFPLDNGEEFVEDMNGFVWKKPITYEEAKTKYRRKLKGKDKDIFDHFSDSNYVNNELQISNSVLAGIDDRYKGMSSTNSNSYTHFTRNGMVWEHTIIFKTDVKKVILTYDNKFVISSFHEPIMDGGILAIA